MSGKLHAGLDLGRKRDYTAVAVLERRKEQRDPLPGTYVYQHVNVYTVKQLDRARQESYEDVANKTARLMRLPMLRGALLAVGETGVGSAVTDTLKARGLSPKAVTITGGDKVNRDGYSYRVPKRDLVTTIALLLESRRLKIPTVLPLVQTLADELHNFKVTISALGHDSYGAGDGWREGAHDDLVLAVALAAWFGEQDKGSTYTATDPNAQQNVDDPLPGVPAWYKRALAEESARRSGMDG